jgi:hypothetical protein
VLVAGPPSSKRSAAVCPLIEVHQEEEIMRHALPGTNMTIFLLFFSLSLLEAIGSRNWVMAALWFALGILFARADVLKP